MEEAVSVHICYWDSTSVASVDSCCYEAEHSSGTSIVASRYQTTASEDWKGFMCSAVTVTFGVHNSVTLSCSFVITCCKCSVNPISNRNPSIVIHEMICVPSLLVLEGTQISL
jgi:hypothetical protein